MYRNQSRALTFLAMLGIGLGAATAQEPTHDPTGAQPPAGDSSQPVGDTWITTKVKTELAAAEDVSALEINVDTVNGTVTLAGTVDSQAEADKAVAVASRVEGVKAVDSSQLRVASSAGTTDD